MDGGIVLTLDELKRGEGDGGTKLRGPFKMTRTYEMRKWKRPKREAESERAHKEEIKE